MLCVAYAAMSRYFKQYMKAVTNPLPEMARYFETENNYLQSLVDEESTVLDVGCGNGRTMKFLAPFVAEITGIDNSKKMIEAARHHLKDVSNTRLVLKNFLNHTFREQFDLVYASYNLLGSAEVLVDGGEALLRHMVAITRPGGHCVAAVWSDTGIDFANTYYPSIGIRVLSIQKNNVVTDMGIFRRFNKRMLQDLAMSVRQPSYTIVNVNDLFYLLDITRR